MENEKANEDNTSDNVIQQEQVQLWLLVHKYFVGAILGEQGVTAKKN